MRTGLTALTTGPSSNEAGTTPDPDEDVEGPQHRVGDQVRPPDQRPDEVAEERQPEQPHRPLEDRAGHEVREPRRHGASGAHVLVARRTPRQGQHAEGDDERRRGAGDREPERDRAGPWRRRDRGQGTAPEQVRRGALSAPRAGATSLSSVCDSISTTPGWSRVRVLSVVPGGTRSPAPGSCARASRRACRPTMCSFNGSPAFTLTFAPVGVDRVALEGDVDRLRAARVLASPSRPWSRPSRTRTGPAGRR